MKKLLDRRSASKIRIPSPLAFGWAGVVLLLILLAGLLAGWIAPYDPLAQDMLDRQLPPGSSGHLLGTDNLGRDVFSRLLYGARVAAQAVAVSVGLGLALGVPPGFLAGYYGGTLDNLFSRLADAVLSFPPLLLAMAIVGVMGPGLTNAMLAIGLVFAPRFFRILRSAVLVVREETYVEASRSMNTPNLYIIFRHVAPNVVPPLLVQVALAGGFALLAEASLSYLGLGVTPPNPSWGRMLYEGREQWAYSIWPILIPTLAIIVTVLCFNFLGRRPRKVRL